MKQRIAFFLCIAALGLCILEAYRAHRNEDRQAATKRENIWMKIQTRAVEGKVETIKIGTKVVDINGRITAIEFPETDVGDVDVRLSPQVSVEADRVDGIFWVSIPSSEPPLLTDAKFEKIKPGMTYAQVGDVLGGVVAKGRMSDGFWSTVEFIEGKRGISLVFADGKVTEKTAEGLE